jgi:hypothetical protein
VSIWLAGAPASATLLVPMDDATLVARSDLVVEGRVERIESALLPGPRVVTRITLAVARALKGTPAAATIVVTEPGGSVGWLDVGIVDAPEFAVGEDVLVFLRRRDDGTLSTTALALGKYTITTELDGVRRARRERPVVDERGLDGFAAAVASQAPATSAPLDGRAGAAIAAAARTAVSDRFTLITNKKGVGARWFDVDCGISIPVARGGAAADYGVATSEAAVETGAAVWTDVTQSAVVLTVDPPVLPRPSVLGGTVDGRNTVTFDDPFGEVQDFDPVACAGVLAQTQLAATSDKRFKELRRRFGGRTFGKILEADVGVNPGMAACIPDPLLLSEVVAHELGHLIGLGHSSQDRNEADPLLRDALMFFLVHADGRGAVVNDDDRAGAATLYPLALLATTPVGFATCEAQLGLLSVSCFEGQLSPAPFQRYRKVLGLARKAARAATPDKQRKTLEKLVKALDRTNAAAASIDGPCGLAMRGRVQRYRDDVAAVLATL